MTSGQLSMQRVTNLARRPLQIAACATQRATEGYILKGTSYLTNAHASGCTLLNTYLRVHPPQHARPVRGKR
eukprot:4499607-Pleurochrysis_carterae.AAC.1